MENKIILYCDPFCKGRFWPQIILFYSCFRNVLICIFLRKNCILSFSMNKTTTTLVLKFRQEIFLKPILFPILDLKDHGSRKNTILYNIYNIKMSLVEFVNVADTVHYSFHFEIFTYLTSSKRKFTHLCQTLNKNNSWSRTCRNYITYFQVSLIAGVSVWFKIRWMKLVNLWKVEISVLLCRVYEFTSRHINMVLTIKPSTTRAILPLLKFLTLYPDFLNSLTTDKAHDKLLSSAINF